MKVIDIVTGPTASGKSSFAFNNALKNNSIIINSDALQVYQENPILSAQPSIEISIVKHYLYGYKNWQDNISIFHYLNDLRNIIDKNLEKNIIIVGGSPMYIKAIIEGLSSIPNVDKNLYFEFQKYTTSELYQKLIDNDNDYAKMIKNTDRQRIERGLGVILTSGKSILNFWKNGKKNIFSDINFNKILILPDKDVVYKNCNDRFDQMIQNGAIEEVSSVVNLYMKNNYLDFQNNNSLNKTSGFKEISLYLQGRMTKEDAIEKAKQSTRNYAKRQYTWFRKFLDWKIIT